MKMMVKTILVAALAGAASVSMANAPVNQAALAPVAHMVTVKQVYSLKDDTPVQLKGYVVKAVGDEKYQFRDATGTITVDIDDDLWQGKALSPTQMVTIVGEVDIDLKPKKRVEIDVDAVHF